jgi:Sap, sulfolipid-1-addressing protein
MVLTLHVLLFALVAATSPLALASVLVVLTGARARIKGAALVIGFVGGQAALFFLMFALGTRSSPDGENHPAVVAIIVITIGSALLVTAAYVRRHRNDPARGPNPRTEAIRSRLANLRPLTALGTGAALGIGGPKRIGVTIAATAVIAAAGVNGADALALAVLYIAVATVLVWVPVLLFVVFGPRAAEWLANQQRWIGLHKQPLTFYPSAALGAVLVVDGIVRLVR